MSINDRKKVWSLRYTPGNGEADAAIAKIAADMGISPVTARLAYNRGYESEEAIRSFLDSSLSDLRDPWEMKDMDRAVERIKLALSKGEKIVIYGDYDVDGVTSVTLLYLYLRFLGADVDYYIPSRIKEGYGVSAGALDTLKEKGCDLIITVDTGITANEEVLYARSLGMDTVVTDHHECHGELPEACAVINPHRPDCPYPFKELAGVGVTFKLVCAFELDRCKGESSEAVIERICERYIDLVAIGTVADVMPLSDENRVIVKKGLEIIEHTDRVGLAALIEASVAPNAAAVKPSSGEPARKRRVNAGFIGFTLAPRINAAGRISSAHKAVDLLLCEDEYAAAEMAAELCEINTRRQFEENRIAEEAYKMIEETHDFERDRVIVLENDSWQQGIIGIVSSRITEKYGLPSILISFDGAVDGEAKLTDVGKGSGRSVKGMNLVEGLDACGELLVRFGGHELAAGLSVMRCNIEEFKKQINDYARELFGDELNVDRREADCILSCDEINMALAEELALFEPFGVSNPTPLFLVKELRVDKMIAMGGGKHTKLLMSKDGRQYQAVFFGVSTSSLDIYPGEEVDLLCQLSVNEYRSQRTVQLLVQDVRLSYGEDEEKETERYLSICRGEHFCASDAVIPDRSDIAEIYKYLKRESAHGHTTFSYRMLRSAFCTAPSAISYLKLRFCLDILDDMGVCRIKDNGDGTLSVDVPTRTEKGSIERSKTYIKLTSQCD